MDFPRDRTIFNYSTREEANKFPHIVVESVMSVLRHTHVINAKDYNPYGGGVGHFEATFGAHVTDKQVDLISKHERVYLWMDNDEAGWKATESLIRRLERSVDLWVIDSPWEEDPGDLPFAVVGNWRQMAIPSSLWSRPTNLRSWRRANGV